MRVLYLHGFASSPASKKAQYLSERLRSCGVALDIPDLAGGDFEHLTISRQLAQVERLASGDPVTLIGSSMGGYIAALYAARHAEVARMVLLAPAFGFAGRWAEAFGEEEIEGWRRTGYLPVFHHGEGRVARVSYGLIEDGLRYEAYPETTQPVLIYHGTEDTVVPYALSEQFARLRPNVRLELVHSDHQLLSSLETIWEGVRGFLEL